MRRLLSLLCWMGIMFAYQTRLLADPPLYMVVYDLDQTEWKVRYTDDGPDLTNDACRTTELWLRYIPAGKFTMGSPTDELGRWDDEVQHEVTLTQPFYIGVFECTQKQWELAKGANPSSYKDDCRPVERVSYDDIRGNGAQAGAGWPTYGHAVDGTSFMGILRAKTGLTFDLPTSAQWEYACRAGTTKALNSDENLESTSSDEHMAEVGRYVYNRSDGKGDYSEHTKAGSYKPNAWGLYDMHGNVFEWCLDRWDGSPYDASSAEDPEGDKTGSRRVVRGGSWDINAGSCRSAFRNYGGPSGRDDDIGFRVLCLMPEAYAVTVVDGTVDKATAYVGETVMITADMPGSGETFDKWTGRGVAFENAAAPVTTFEMPANNVTVTATFKKLPSVKTYKIVVVNGKADKAKAVAGETVTLTANPPPAGKVFDRWTGGAAFDDPNAAETTFVMPAKAVTPKALYKRK